MTRLIVMTFAALGWCFYVVSDGPNFEPRGLRAEQPVRVAATPKPAPPASTQARDLVTNVALRTPLTRVETETTPTEDAAAAVPVPANLEGFSGLTAFDDQAASITLASLEDGVAGLQQTVLDVQDQTTEVFEPKKDIREITGTRVNVRDGPGTIYPIIGKVAIGQKVEVLSESGTGWLRLRVLPAQQVGWISASLVQKTAN
ncbi:SH3 domain-containing protein [Ruegeria halocynthiae]|uniref:SH3 domain-containing protein n=1 Tax=Ruegeria halocynthiae TaxID=985054 RepID=UPI000AF925B6|nr:SH3 domain-containing protein [Ruegeria halocynthiae]